MDAVRAEQALPTISELVFPPTVFAESEREAQTQALRCTNHAQAAIGAFNLGLFDL